jgi:hypothetical protein
MYATAMAVTEGAMWLSSMTEISSRDSDGLLSGKSLGISLLKTTDVSKICLNGRMLPTCLISLLESMDQEVKRRIEIYSQKHLSRTSEELRRLNVKHLEQKD